ncbi:MAG: UDP-glucose 4-epimerase [Crocinitomicaceae bacterium]|jgi:UDP-glucose 4-epimerase
MEKKNFTLVTGGAGYIGSHTVVELLKNGQHPIIVDDFRNSERRAIEGIEKISGATVISVEIDVNDKAQLTALFKQYSISGIIHFAADKAVGESVENPLKYYKNNLGGLINCLECALEFEVENFVFSSSCTVYGDPDNGSIVTEDSPQKKANSPYGSTKQMGEQILQDVVNSGANLKVLNLRYFNPIGAHASGLIGELPIGKPNNLLPYVTQTALGLLDKLTVFGNSYNTPDGTCIRDYIHVVDLANAHVNGLRWLESQPNPGFEIMNVGTGKGTSVLEIIHTFEKVSGTQLNWAFGDRRAGDVEQIYADTSKAKELMGWQATKSMEDAVRDAWNWEQKLRNE